MSQRLPTLASWLLLWALASGTAAQTKSPLDASPNRRYSQGPLTASDYQAEPPDAGRARGRQSGLTTEIKYDFHYQVTKQKDKLVGYVDSIAIYAVVLRDESWSKNPQDKTLLDHDQGRFDIAQMEALRAQIELTRRFDEEPLEATAKKEVEVYQTLDREIRKLLRPYVDAAFETHAEYERVTRFGTLPDEQAEARHEQREQVKKLTAAAAKTPMPKP